MSHREASARSTTKAGGKPWQGIVEAQRQLLDLWRHAATADLLRVSAVVKPAVVRDGLEHLGLWAPAGSLVLVVWSRSRPEPTEWMAAFGALAEATGNGSDGAVLRHDRALENLMHRVAQVEGRAEATIHDDLLAIADLEFDGRSVLQVPVDRRLGFALERLPYTGGRFDPALLRVRLHHDPKDDLAATVLLRGPMISALENDTGQMLKTRRPRFRAQPLSVFGHLVHEAKHVGKDALHDGKDFVQAGKEVTKGAAHFVATQGKTEVQNEQDGRQGVGPGDVDNAGQADGGGADGAGEDAVDGAEVTLDAAGAALQPGQMTAVQGPAPLGDEPTLDELLAARNRVLESR